MIYEIIKWQLRRWLPSFFVLCDLAEVVLFCMCLCYKYLTSPRSLGERHILGDLSEVGYL